MDGLRFGGELAELEIETEVVVLTCEWVTELGEEFDPKIGTVQGTGFDPELCPWLGPRVLVGPLLNDDTEMDKRRTSNRQSAITESMFWHKILEFFLEQFEIMIFGRKWLGQAKNRETEKERERD